MPTYAYVAMNSSGQEVKEEVDANTADEAIAKVRSKGYFPTKVKEKAAKKAKKKAGGGEEAPAAAKKKMPISIGGVPRKQLVAFTRQLSTLQDAGLPILRSLQILEQQQKPGLLKAIIGGVADDVEGGGSLSDAMAKYPKAFDKLYVNMVNAGEAGGVLDLILARLADFMEKAQKLKKKVIGAMIYPVVVISIAVGIVSMIMIFVIPKFEQIFKDFKVNLPDVTKALLVVSRWFANDYGWAYVIAFPFIFIAVLKLARMSEGGKYAVDIVKLKIPILGGIVSKSVIARFTRTLGTLISILEPVMVVVLGLIVGFIVIALFMPMITLIGAVSGTKSK